MELIAYANGAATPVLRLNAHVPKDVLVPDETVKALQTKWI